MRLFIAIDLPEEFSPIFREVQKVFGGVGKVNFTNEYHCTLKFLGDVEDGKVEDIKENLSKVIFEPFEVALDNLGVFPNEDYARVLWVGLDGNVNELQQKVEEALLGMFKPDDRFHPHVTLGRIKFVENKNSFKEKLKAKVPPEKFLVKEFKLIKSTLTPHGPKYEVVESFHSS